jgi:predicted nucleic-acid-binding protein
MTGVDTNILLRFLVEDNVAQTERAKAFFRARSAEMPAFIGWIVLAELVWTLRARYGYPKSHILAVVSALRDRPDIVVERADLVGRAIELADAGAGFADALIALGNEAAGCDGTVTFDRHASRMLAPMTLLS